MSEASSSSEGIQPLSTSFPSPSRSGLRRNTSTNASSNGISNYSNTSSISPFPLSAFAILVFCFCVLHGLFITCEARAAAVNVTSAYPSSSSPSPPSPSKLTASSEYRDHPAVRESAGKVTDSFNAGWAESRQRLTEKRRKSASVTRRRSRKQQHRVADEGQLGGPSSAHTDNPAADEGMPESRRAERTGSHSRIMKEIGKTSSASLRGGRKQKQEARGSLTQPEIPEKAEDDKEKHQKDDIMMSDSQEIVYVSVETDDEEEDQPTSDSLLSPDDGFWNNSDIMDTYQYDDFPGIWETQRPAPQKKDATAPGDKAEVKSGGSGRSADGSKVGSGSDGGSVPSPSWQQLPTDQEISRFKKLVERTMACRNLPALTLALVKGGHVLLTANLGHADPEHHVPVTRSTRFAIGSLTKAFTSTVVSEVLQRLNVSLDRPIHKLMPENFQLMDEMRTHSVTIRDLLGHRTGVPGYFHALLMGFPAHVTRRQLLSRLRYIPAVVPLRSQFIYNNYLYTLAAHVVEHLTGRTWEALVRDLILDPLGMRATGFVDEMKDFGRFALPCAMLNGTVKNLSPDLLLSVSPCGPAGSLFSTAHDMARWLQVLLGDGKRPDGERVLQESALRETIRAVMPPPGIGTDLTRPEFPIGDVEQSYGMGWVTSNYRGYRKVWHSGGIVTYSSRLWLLPGAGAGLFVATNGPQTRAKGHALTAITSMAADLLLGEAFWLNSSTVCSFPMPWRQASESPDDPSSSTATIDATAATAAETVTTKASAEGPQVKAVTGKAASASSSSSNGSASSGDSKGTSGTAIPSPSDPLLNLSSSLAELVGVYTHKAFGDMVIELGEGSYYYATTPGPAPARYSSGSDRSRRAETTTHNNNDNKGIHSDDTKLMQSSSNSAPKVNSDLGAAGRAAREKGGNSSSFSSSSSSSSSSSTTDWLMLRFGRFGQLKLQRDPGNPPNGWEGRFVGPLWYVTASDESDSPVRVRFLRDEAGRVDRIRFPIDQLYDVIEFRKRQPVDVTASSSYSASCHGSTFESVLMTVAASCLSGLSLVKRLTVT